MKTKTTAFMDTVELINFEIEMNDKAYNELEKAYKILRKYNLYTIEVIEKQVKLTARNRELKNLLK